MEVSSVSRYGRVIKKPNRYEPDEIPEDDYPYETDDSDSDSYSDDSSDDSSDSGSEMETDTEEDDNGNLKDFVVYSDDE